MRRSPRAQITRDLACASCHLSYELEDGARVVRYVPLGTQCLDCHDPGSVVE
jgi:hypothetical protein